MNPEPLFHEPVPANQPGVPMSSAQVLAVEDGGFRIRHAGGVCHAHKAFACLVQPEPGDRVLTVNGDTGETWIITIVERVDNAPTRLVAQGDLEIQAETCRVQGRKSVALFSPGDVNLAAGNTTLESGTINARFAEATLVGKTLTSAIDVLRGFHDLVDQTAKSLFQRAGTYMRQTESLDRVKSAQMERQAQGMFNLNTKFTVLMSSKDTKIDGERIHMG